MHSILNNNFKKIKFEQSYPSIVAFGADLKSAFAVAKGKDIFLSPALGDLADPKINQIFQSKLNFLVKSLKIKPRQAVCDLHPTYFSTQLAEDFSQSFRIPLKRVQHHHAHIASVCLENNFHKPALGVSFDGTGFGEDKAVWGGEFLLVDKNGFQRLAHLDYVDLPGADSAAQEPWRMGLVYLYKTFKDKAWNLKIDFLRKLNKNKAKLILQMIDKNINNCQTSSAGRLFDAVASVTGVCQINKFEAQAPQMLERLADKNLTESYKFKISNQGRMLIIDAKGVFRKIVEDILKKIEIGVISAKFHNGIALMTLEVLRKLRKRTSIQHVALSGGVFQNKLLFNKTKRLLEEDGFRCLFHKTTSPNDISIPLGQIQVASNSFSP